MSYEMEKGMAVDATQRPDYSVVGMPEVAKVHVRRSATIGELVKAVCKASKNFAPIFKDSENPAFGRKLFYAPLENLISATRNQLADEGLTVFQFPQLDGKNLRITTILAHISNEWFESDLELPASMRDQLNAQSIGSAITYGRRYSYGALLNVAGEVDDDGNEASNPASAKAAHEVAEQKIAAYKEKAAAQVQDKVVEVYPQTGADHTVYWCFADGPAYRLLLDNGLADVTKKHPTIGVRYIKDEPDVWMLVEGVAAKLHVTVRKRNEETAKGGAILPNEKLITAVEMLETKKHQPYAKVTIGQASMSCFDSGIYALLHEGSYADVQIETKGKYSNIVGLISLNGRTLSRMEDGSVSADIQRDSYKATDADLPKELFHA